MLVKFSCAWHWLRVFALSFGSLDRLPLQLARLIILVLVSQHSIFTENGSNENKFHSLPDFLSPQAS